MSEMFKFEKQTYNGISIIRETTTGYVNASQMCSSNGKVYRQFKTTKQFKEIIEIYEEFIKSHEIHKEIQGVVFPTPYFEIDYTKDFQGTYIHPKLVHFIAEYCSKRYSFIVSELMDSINDSVHERLKQENKPDTPENAKPIFEQQVAVVSHVVSDNENQQCWGIREHGDKLDYLDSWDKSAIFNLMNKFKEDLIKQVKFSFEDLKHDYPQLFE